GTVTSGALTDGVIVMTDKRTKVSISKVDGNGQALKDAKLQILDVNKNPVKDADDKELTWTSTGDLSDPWIVEGILKAGETYYLHEVEAPSGYQLAGDQKFIVATNGEDQTITMTDAKQGELIVEKQDDDKNLLAGATLKLTAAETVDWSNVKLNDESVTANENSIEWVSTNQSMKITGLNPGTYTLKEVSAPAGYQKADPIEIVIAKDGTITVGDDKSGTVTMVDKANTLTINKTAFGGDGTTVVSGASMKLTATNADGTAIDLSHVSGVNNTNNPSQENNVIAWISTGSDTLSALPAGEYTLEETIAPDGYKLPVFSTFTFTVNEDGTVEAGSSETDGAFTLDETTITVADEKSVINISKMEVGAREELPGAELTLTLDTPAEDGATLKSVTLTGGSEKTEERTDSKIVWISTKDSAILTGLPDGTYTLSEVAVPKDDQGNETHVQAESITFIVENGIVKTIIISGEDAENYDDDGYVEGTNVVTGTAVVMRDATTTTTTTTTSETTTSETTT
ncbi:MAG: collagen binding domain-containing protein, partial [Ruminococcus sp.]